MTKNEAIDRLENMAWIRTNDERREDIQEAIDLAIEALSAEAVTIHKDGTLNVKVPNAQKVGRVLVMDTDSHIGGGLFYPDEAVQGWIPFTRRPMTEEEQKDYPNCTFMFDCVLPDDGDEILVSNRRFVWMDTFCSDVDGCYLDGGDDIDEDMAWMPLPKPYKGGAE